MSEADSVSENPFIVRFKPPIGETEEQRIQRVRASQDAQRISKQIDDSLLESKRFIERRKKATRILLLGQAESGKSSVLKNFQMAFTPNQFQKERVVWKTIIHLNLIGSIKTILSILLDVDPNTLGTTSPLTPPLTPPTTPPQSPHTTTQAQAQAQVHGGSMSRTHRKFYLSLSPLLSVETNLNRMIFSDLSSGSRDICVRAGTAWKSKLGLGFKDPLRGSFESENQNLNQNLNQNQNQLTQAQMAMKDDLCRMLQASKDDIVALWADEEVQEVLGSRGVMLAETSGFFLDDVARITSPDYQPTDCDIVRARVRTVGVEEHHLVAESNMSAVAPKGSEFFIADVGGARSSRSSWIPYFDDVQAILFLAPLAFNQMLEEDPRVNRLEDTLMIWREICSSVLLADCNLIVFFNKKDILKKTLESGVLVRKFVPSYGDAPNDVPNVTKYFKDRFKGYHRKLSPKPRAFISHSTSAIDIRSTTALVIAVHDGIIRNNLQKSDMI